MQRISLLKDVMILSGAGVGGGSLVYANTLYQPPDPFFDDRAVEPHHRLAGRVGPGVRPGQADAGRGAEPTLTPSDLEMRAVAEEMGVGDTFHPTPVGVFFGEPGVEVDDPFFGGVGPSRRGCIECGECMTGCRHGAKNTLLKNYLYLAEAGGAVVRPLTTVTSVRPACRGRLRGRDGTHRKLASAPARQTLRAGQVVFAAGTMGTQRLMHRLRDQGQLPNLSPRLGELTRTNSEAILGARTFRSDVDFTKGVAITSSFHPDADTHVEPVRYGKGSNAMGMLSTALADGDRTPRALGWLAELRRNPVGVVRNMSLRKWSEQTIIALVMQTRDNSITCYTKPGLFGRRLTSKQGHGEPNPTWIPAGHDVVRRLARRIGGWAAGGWNDVFNIPMTAHFLGGAVIGDSPDTGVIDPYHRVYGYPGLHVVDGAAVSANLGVNPSLTITAQAERAMSLWPNHGQADPRPPMGSGYQRLEPVEPDHPVVPASAPAALRLTAKPRPPVGR